MRDSAQPPADLLRCTMQIQPNVAPYDSYTARTCCNAPMESLKWILKQQSAPSETAAIIVEPIMGEGGFLTPPPSFLPTLRKICDEHGIVLIIDEVIFLSRSPHESTAQCICGTPCFYSGSKHCQMAWPSPSALAFILNAVLSSCCP